MQYNPVFFDINQNSDDWDELRCGLITASMCSDLFADKKTKTYQDVITKVAFERVTGKQQKQFTNKWMEYGHETEPEAEENYVIETFSEVSNGGFYKANEWFGASPDRKIINENGGCEFKCPSIATYREYLENFDKKNDVILPKDYFYQVHGQMLATGWDYVDYMPYYSINLRQLITRVNRDENILNLLKSKIDEAVLDIEILIKKTKR